MSLGVGIDLVRTDEILASLARDGERYVQRVYTAAEQRECGSDPRRLAARFAAKEATLKALRWGDEALSWRSIGVARDENGRHCIRLSGPAAAFAERRGVRRLDVSLSHGRAMAGAVVVAELSEVV
jgi:holo-[acyl-carrier protein] synthase